MSMYMNQDQWSPRGGAGTAGSSAAMEPARRSFIGGLWHAWLLLTGPGDDAPQRTVADRARLARSRASSSVIFGLLLFALLALPLGLQDPTHATLVADVILAVAILVASALNRIGAITPAGWVLVLVLLVAIVGAVAGAPKLDYIYLPAFDLLAIPVMVAALVLPLRWVWVVSIAGAALVVADMMVQPRSTTPTSLAQFVASYGIYSLMIRPVILVLVTAILVFLLGFLLQRQVARADRAEEVAELERQQLEQRRQLEFGVQQLLETHVRLANGDYNARAMLPQDNQLWQVGVSLNNLVTRLQRAGQSDFELRRTREELQRLAQAMDEARTGKRPFWPAPSGTAVDLIIERVAPRSRQPLPPPASPAQPPRGGMESPIGGPLQGAGSWLPPQHMPTPYPQHSGPSNPQSGFRPMPGVPGMPGISTDDPTTGSLGSTGSLGAPWGQPDPFAHPQRGQAGGNNGGGNVVPENPWFVPPEGFDS